MIPKAEANTRPRLFYGWWISLSLHVITVFSHGIGYYVIPVMVKPLAGDFGWSRTSVSALASIQSLSLALSAPWLGGWCDRFGPRRVMLLSAPIFGAALILLSFTGKLWYLYAVYALVGLSAAGLHTVPVSATITRWFRRRQGTALGIALAGFSVGGFVIAPFAGYLNETLGWRMAFVILGVLSWLFLLPLITRVIKDDPREKGISPDGLPLPPQTSASLSSRPGAKAASYSFRALARSPTFWLISLSFFLVSAAGVGALTHQVAFFTDIGMSTLTAATAAGITAGFGILGKVGSGYFGDRMPKTWMTVLFFSLQGVGILVLLATTSASWAWLFVVVYGFSWGATAVVRPLVVTDFFGAASFGVVYGWVALISSLGAAAGAPFAGWVYDLTGRYGIAFLSFLIAYMVAVLFLLLALRLKAGGRRQRPPG